MSALINNLWYCGELGLFHEEPSRA